MNRTYTRERFIELANLIRNKLPKVGISTDIIVGFPGENDFEFNETLQVMDEVKFDSAFFTFKYSSRPEPRLQDTRITYLKMKKSR